MTDLQGMEGRQKERWIGRISKYIEEVLGYHDEHGAPFKVDLHLPLLRGIFERSNRRLFVDGRVGVCSLRWGGVAVCWVEDDLRHALGVTDREHRYITGQPLTGAQSVYVPRDTSDIVAISGVKGIDSVLQEAAALIVEQAQ